MKITISGHGGHCCEAYLNGCMEIGYTINDAIGQLIRNHPKECGLDVEILPCSTSAYERSFVNEQGKEMVGEELQEALYKEYGEAYICEQ